MSERIRSAGTHSLSIQPQDFSVDEENAGLLAACQGAGALVNFVGLVRERNLNAGQQSVIESMTLEHYAGMTEKSIAAIQREAGERWDIKGSRVIHRIGNLLPGAQIVYVGACSAHRGESFAACEFIMDFLKTQAPFWKKEQTSEGSYWVDAREGDARAQARWGRD